MHFEGAKIKKDEVRFSVRELKALDYCRSVGWATSEEEIAENTGLSETEAAWFVEKCVEGGVLNMAPPCPKFFADQFDELAKFIQNNFPEEIIGGGAVEVAIKIMEEFRGLLVASKEAPK